jgi:ribose transport system permease protein
MRMKTNKNKGQNAEAPDMHDRSALYRLLAMIVFVVLALVFVPRFGSQKNLLNLVRNIALLCLMGYGMSLSMMIGGLDLSIGSVAALSSVLGAAIISGGNVALGVTAALAMGASIGMLNGFMIARFKLPDFIMTFSMMYIARGLALTYTQGQAIYNLPAAFTWIGKGFLGPVAMPIVFSVAILLVLHFALRHTTFGRGVYAVGSSHEAAFYTGISVSRKQISVYAISGILAAAVGLIYVARLNSANADLGHTWPLDAIAVCVIGGVSFAGGEGSILGLLIGGTVMGIIGNCINVLGIPSRFQDFFVGFVIILAVAADHYAKKRRS